jgi:hypothetical protein
MLPFLAEGFEARDKLLNIIDKNQRAERLGRLQRSGIDVQSAERSGQLELRPWEQAHVAGGHFDQHAMLDLLDQHAASGKGRYRMTRLWSNQEWALEPGLPGVEDILEYEAGFDYIWPKYDLACVCVYDAKKFGASIMMQMLRTHPYVIIDGLLRENVYYVPPDQLLKEMRGQRADVRMAPADRTASPI